MMPLRVWVMTGISTWVRIIYWTRVVKKTMQRMN